MVASSLSNFISCLASSRRDGVDDLDEPALIARSRPPFHEVSRKPEDGYEQREEAYLVANVESEHTPEGRHEQLL